MKNITVKELLKQNNNLNPSNETKENLNFFS